MDETWLDVMPVLPLARGVPVVLVDDEGPCDKDICDGLFANTGGASLATNVGPESLAEEGIRVLIDLDDPQGFGYALRWGDARPSRLGETLCDRLLDRWACGDETDADRLALARALREVTRG